MYYNLRLLIALISYWGVFGYAAVYWDCKPKYYSKYLNYVKEGSE